MGTGVTTTDTEHGPLDPDLGDPDLGAPPHDLRTDGSDGVAGADDHPLGSAPATSAGRRPVARRRPAADLDRATVRRVLTRYAEVVSLTAADLRLTANLLGCDTEPDAIAEASLTGAGASATSALRDLAQITSSETDMDALIVTIELGADRVRSVNALLAAVQDRPPRRLQTSEAKAARQLVVAARLLPPESLHRATQLAALLA